MKVRTTITILLLLSLTGTVFYFGWVQILLPEDSYAVAFTKTAGWDEEVMEAGKFTWRWERVIPTNMKLHIFHLQPRSAVVTHSADLPSAKIYSEFLNNEAEFRYELELRIQYTIDPMDLPRLVSEGGLRHDSVDDFYQTLESGLHEHIVELTPIIVNNTTHSTDSDRSVLAATQNQLRHELEQFRPDIRILSLDITKLSVPDLDLYHDARKNFAAVQSFVTQARGEAQAVAIRREILERSRLDILEQYGRVLADYPELLDYFRLQGDSGVDLLNLGSLQVTVDD
ncbi:MAG: hypothetical protein EA428_03095 [Spirochaetaceae bacterium]|nr:MAG: hypothetical protein EA428_03095 [Spirochaetaceae bacterium]